MFCRRERRRGESGGRRRWALQVVHDGPRVVGAAPLEKVGVLLGDHQRHGKVRRGGGRAKERARADGLQQPVRAVAHVRDDGRQV
ncbi:hypothetical protein EG859_15470, partial [Enterococcus faecalis]